MTKKKSNGYGKGTFTKTKLFLSQAFISLGLKGTSPTVSSYSHNLLMMFLGKRQFGNVKDKKGQKRKVRTDDNRFTLTYKELESYGIKQSSATRGFDELLAKGFISIVEQGGAYEKHKSVYALEDTYLCWTKTEQQEFYTRMKKDVHRGYQNPEKRGKFNSTRVNEGHPHTRQRGTLQKRTHAPTGDTLLSLKTANRTDIKGFQ